MAEGKKSALVYCDFIHSVEPLTDEEAGKVFKHFLRYINDLNPQAPDRLTGIIFEPWKQSLKRDLRKWEERQTKNTEAGRKGAEKRWGADKVENSIKEHELFKPAKNSTDSFFQSLIDGNEINEISRVTKIPLDTLKSKIEPFRKAADLEYPNYGKFVNHFKNWVLKSKNGILTIPIRTNKLT